MPLVGSALDIGRTGVLHFFEDCWRRYGDTFQVHVGGQRWVVMVHPDAVHHVLVRARHNYIKGEIYEPIRLLGGNGIVFDEGPSWQRARKLMQPSFHHRKLAELVERMVDAVDELLLRLRRCGTEPVDFHHEMIRMSMRIVGDALFDIDLGDRVDTTGPALAEILELVSERVNSAAPLPLWVPTSANRRFQRAMTKLDEVVYEIIERVRSTDPAERRTTLLSLLLDTRDADTGAGLSDRELRDQVVNLFIAGHETTALNLTWTWIFLASRPQLRQRLREEVDRVLGDRRPSFADLAELHLTKQTLLESMRLRPPLWAVARNCVDADEIGGHPIPAGATVILPIYLTHRHPEFWPRAQDFEPDRFTPEAIAARHKFAYFPFSTGPRICLGDTFALAEGQLALAMLIRRCEGELVDGVGLEHDARISLRPRDPVMVQLRWHDEDAGATRQVSGVSSPLAGPLRWLNRVGARLDALNVGPRELCVDALLDHAREQTGLTDFGADDFEPLLRRFVWALEHEAQLSLVGRGLMRTQLQRLLVNRLRVEADIRANPELLDVPITAPIFIVGFPRTGTTLLHNLMALDADNRVPLLWELMWPSPPPEPATRHTDPRIEITRRRLRLGDIVAPEIRAIHALDPTGPEECYYLFQLCFANPLFDAEVDVPSYMGALDELDWRGPYRYHARVLGLLQHHIRRPRWVLKAPSHLHTLGALLAVYPDARVIQTHRDPCTVAASFCSTYEATRSLYSEAIDLDRLGREWLRRWGRAVDHALDVRAAASDFADGARFVDVHYEELVADPIATLGRIYTELGLDLDPETVVRARSYMARNPKGKHGSHRYSLARYGLQSAQIQDRFRRYLDTFFPDSLST